MTLQTRRPTGLPSWPMILLAGVQGAGKSWAIAVASSSPLVDRTLWLTLGEVEPDEYGAIPGADFEIVTHDGTFEGIVSAIRAVAAEPTPNGKPHLLGVDSMTKLWDLCVDNVQQIANERSKGRRNAAGEFAISPDLWNVAKGNWDALLDAIRMHRGPKVVTARLDLVMVMEDGQPTKDKVWKVQAHKSLPYDVDVLIEMHERGHALITKAKSVRLQIEKPILAPKFSIVDTWKRLGLEEGVEVSDQTFSRPMVEQADLTSVIERWRKRAGEQTERAGFEQVYADALRAEVPAPVLDAIRKVAGDFQAALKAKEPLDGVEPKSDEKPHDWVAEARALSTGAAVNDLRREAMAKDATQEVIATLADIAAEKEGAAASPEAGGEWAAAEEAPDAWDQGSAAVLADEAADAEVDAAVESLEVKK